MDKNKKVNHDEEIIETSQVATNQPEVIKIKIKERVSLRKRRHISIWTKMVFIISACILGFYVGSKFIERYMGYWQKHQIGFPSEEKGKTPQLKTGEVFSASQK